MLHTLPFLNIVKVGVWFDHLDQPHPYTVTTPLSFSSSSSSISAPALVISTSPPNSLLTVDTSQEPDTPDSAIDSLSFGANQFTPTSIMVASGYFVTMSKDQQDVLSLWLSRRKDRPQLIAQLQADDDITFDIKLGNVRIRDGLATFGVGPTPVSGPTKFYYLMKATF